MYQIFHLCKLATSSTCFVRNFLHYPLVCYGDNYLCFRSNWNYFREIQLRSFGLSYHKKASLGGVRYNSNQFQSRAYGSKHIVERLTLQHLLTKHGGCVNSLNFNSSGTLLASGSDDLKINLWNWQTGKLVQSIASEHRMNVFQTKFLEASGYQNEIKIISTGRDGQVSYKLKFSFTLQFTTLLILH